MIRRVVSADVFHHEMTACYGDGITHVVVPCATGDLQPLWAASGRPNSTAERNLVAVELEPIS